MELMKKVEYIIVRIKSKAATPYGALLGRDGSAGGAVVGFQPYNRNLCKT
jgi:hypothetical protein